MKKRKIIIVFVIMIIAVVLFLFLNKKEKTDENIVNIEDILGKTVTQDVVKVQDLNGDIFYIPKGFKISDEFSEQKVAEGLVIIDGTKDDETSGSEFVWIPVNNESLENLQTIFKTKVEIEQVGYINQTEDYEEYNNFIQSISKYKGFYIARFEAGISETLKEVLIKDEIIQENNISKNTIEYANGKYKPVSKRNAKAWNYIEWGGDYTEKASDNLAGNDEKNGAVKVARSMYNTGKTNVVSTLCYGTQWDAILNFIDNNYYSNSLTEDSIILNSKLIGNYSENINSAGYNINNCIKNIYDLAGNVSEWTMEGYGDTSRVIRGGSSLNMLEISSKIELYPNDMYRDVGFRIALYIKD